MKPEPVPCTTWPAWADRLLSVRDESRRTTAAPVLSTTAEMKLASGLVAKLDGSLALSLSVPLLPVWIEQQAAVFERHWSAETVYQRGALLKHPLRVVIAI